MEILIICVGLGIAAGIIAQNKGRSFLGYFVLGTFVPIVGLVIALAVGRNTEGVDRRELASGDSKKCPYCAELIKLEARVCRYCGRDLLESVPLGGRDWEASEVATRLQERTR